MKMFNQDHIAKIGLSNSKTGKTMTLWANLIDTNISKKWIEVINENNFRKYSLKSNYIKYKSLDEERIEFDELKQNISYINANYDRALTHLTTIEDLIENDDVLNILHEEYEIYGDRLDEVISSGYFE